jgi:hypothetical protein
MILEWLLATEETVKGEQEEGGARVKAEVGLFG